MVAFNPYSSLVIFYPPYPSQPFSPIVIVISFEVLSNFFVFKGFKRDVIIWDSTPPELLSGKFQKAEEVGA